MVYADIKTLLDFSFYENNSCKLPAAVLEIFSAPGGVCFQELPPYLYGEKVLCTVNLLPSTLLLCFSITLKFKVQLSFKIVLFHVI